MNQLACIKWNTQSQWIAFNVRVNSNREHPPRANPGHLFHDESWGTGI